MRPPIPSELSFLVHNSAPETGFSLLTPPLTATFKPRRTPSLPSIATLSRDIEANFAMQKGPLTPPDDLLAPSDPSDPMLVDRHSQVTIDWIDWTRTRSAHFIAEKTCEMICYVWFARPHPSDPSSSSSAFTSPLFKFLPTTTLQLVATPAFVTFMQKLLETTQVSQSVIVLALHYIHRFKTKNDQSPAQPGSEFRIAIVGLIMANKFLDDNTYTNKTWAEISGIELKEMNRMEAEFLQGIDFNLYVDRPTYESWLNLLKGLVMAKERDSRRLLHGTQRRHSRPSIRSHDVSPSARRQPASAVDGGRGRHRSHAHRARSTSPHPLHRPPMPPLSIPAVPVPVSTPISVQVPTGGKRSADTAFSPTSAALTSFPSKRPLSMSLVIPDVPQSGFGGQSPLESLHGFSKLKLDSPTEPQMLSGSTWVPSRNPSPQRQTLGAPYAIGDQHRKAPPPQLYFYSLSCSPLNSSQYPRKGQLRYHQPHAPSSYDMYSSPGGPPNFTNPFSSSSSMTPAPSYPISRSSLPYPNLATPSRLYVPRPAQSATTSPVHYTLPPPPPPPDVQSPFGDLSSNETCRDGGRPGTFANAGPAGVNNFYPTPDLNRGLRRW